MTTLKNSEDPVVQQIMNQIAEVKKRVAEDISAYYFDNIFQVIEGLSDREKDQEIARAAIEFANRYADFYKWRNLKALEPLEQAMEKFISLTHDHKIWQLIKKPIHVISQIIGGLVLGVIGLGYGLVSGFVKSCCEIKNPFTIAFWSTFATNTIASGLIGAVVGTRAPEQLYNKLLNQTEYAKLGATIDRLRNIHRKYLNTGEYNLRFDVREVPKGKEGIYLNDQALKDHVREKIITQCFQTGKDSTESLSPEESKQAFEAFLNSKQAIQVCTQKAGFSIESLKGSVGHHAIIRIAIDEHELLPIEFGFPSAHSPAMVDQAEEMRIVTGQQIFDMMVHHERMKHIQNFSLEFMMGEYKPGEYDCHTYVNQILQSVGLKRSPINRFVRDVDSVGSGIHEFVLNKSCLFTQSELKQDAEQIPVRSYTRQGYLEYQKEHAKDPKNVSKEEKWQLQRAYTGFDSKARQAKIKASTALNENEANSSSTTDRTTFLQK